MQQPDSLAGALERARRERAEVLPGDFAAGVMDRIQAAEAFRRRSLFVPALAMAAAIVFTAGVVSFYAGGGHEGSAPPRLGIFGSPGSHSPLAAAP